MRRKYIEAFKREVSCLAFGGVIVMNESQEDANRFVAEAIESGVNYFDVAPSYGNAEDRLGPALLPYRDQVFLACKTMDRTAEGALRELTRSLEKMQTDYFDLYQLHAVYNLEDVDRIFSPGGAMETYLKAKADGVIKHIGFSAHSTEAALALMDRYDFDSILFPFNFVSLLKNGYGAYVLERALSKKMAVLGIKAMALTEHKPEDTEHHPKAWYHPIEDMPLALKAVKFTLSRGVDVIVPPGDMAHFRWGVSFMGEDLTLEADDLKVLKEVAQANVPLFPLKAR